MESSNQPVIRFVIKKKPKRCPITEPHDCSKDHGNYIALVSEDNELFSNKIGTHIPKNKNFYQSLIDFFGSDGIIKDKPVQIFTGSPKFWKRPQHNQSDISKTCKFVTENNLQVFIHSIYLINLSKPADIFMEKAYDCLVYELDIGVRMGFKGVVVHCGKSLELTEEEAINNMYQNIMIVYNNDKINLSNPLLIETSSGQGSETCWEIKKFKKFYSLFNSEQREKIKICIDTCHVYAAGHDPLEYLQDWNDTFPGSIVLVHYNDSKESLGKKKDRHAYPGKGYIGKKQMDNIASWCIDNNLPMVIE